MWNCKKRSVKDIYLYEKADFGKLNRLLLAVNWDEYLDSRDIEKIRTLFKKLQDAIDECIPKRELQGMHRLRRRTNKVLPMNKRLWVKIKKKTKTLDEIKEMKEEGRNNTREYILLQQDYRRIYNQVKQETRRAIKNMEETIAENIKTNLKIFWKYIQYKTKVSSSVNDLYMDSKKL